MKLTRWAECWQQPAIHEATFLETRSVEAKGQQRWIVGYFLFMCLFVSVQSSINARGTTRSQGISNGNHTYAT